MNNFKILTTAIVLLLCNYMQSQVILNGKIDNLSELSLKKTVYTVTKDGIKLGTDITVPMFRDSITTLITIGTSSYPVVIIPKNTQYVVYDTVAFGPKSMSLPTVFTRTPYNKSSDSFGSSLFPFLGYNYALQDMRGCYSSEGVYYPMFSDSWQKAPYMSGAFMPMDLNPTTSLSNSMFHSDGSEAVMYLADSLKRIFDYNLDGVMDTMPYTNRKIGMYGASALGNTQYQALSNISFTNTNNPIKCLMPIVATNEHFNTTLFHNGVYLTSLANGWITGQIYSVVNDALSGSDLSISNNIHSPADYGYTNKATLAKEIIDWNFANPIMGGPSGSHPSSMWRAVMDASKAPIDASGNSNAAGTLSRYKNLNKPTYHLTGWWDIFINGQIETFNKMRKENPGSKQKLVIGPWTHQRISSDSVGDVKYPSNVSDVLGLDYDRMASVSFTGTTNIVEDLFNSELVAWYRENLGGEPFFFIPESHKWQLIGTDSIRVPAKNYFAPYHQFINYLGGKSTLANLPIEIKMGTIITPIAYSLPVLTTPVFALTNSITPKPLSYFTNVKDVRMYITGPTNDPVNANVGNYWIESDSIPFVQGTSMQKYYLHTSGVLNQNAPVINEGTLSYVNDPDNPVITVGGNNMTVRTPSGLKNSQGSMNLAHSDYVNFTMNRTDVLKFETASLTDTLRIIGFPKANIRAKANHLIQPTNKTDFDVFVRVLDVYPDGREMFITEGAINARNKDYAKSIHDNAINDNILPANVDTNQFYNFEFNMLPIGHVFGKNHKLKILISSSNFPKYQSNPHIPLETNEFFRYFPDSAYTYNYLGNVFTAKPSNIVFEISNTNPSFITLPQNTSIPNSVNTVSKVEPQVSIYPNPSTGLFYCLFNQVTSGTVKLFDITGKLMFQNSFYNKELINLNLDSYNNGVYFLEITTDNHSKSTTKLIKM